MLAPTTGSIKVLGSYACQRIRPACQGRLRCPDAPIYSGLASPIISGSGTSEPRWDNGLAGSPGPPARSRSESEGRHALWRSAGSARPNIRHREAAGAAHARRADRQPRSARQAGFRRSSWRPRPRATQRRHVLPTWSPTWSGSVTILVVLVASRVHVGARSTACSPPTICSPGLVAILRRFPPVRTSSAPATLTGRARSWSRGEPIHDPTGSVSRLDLEDLVLAYMGSATASAHRRARSWRSTDDLADLVQFRVQAVTAGAALVFAVALAVTGPTWLAGSTSGPAHLPRPLRQRPPTS